MLLILSTNLQAVTNSPTRLYEDDILEHWLGSIINDCPGSLHLLVLEHASGEYLVRQLDLQLLGVEFPDTAPHYYRGERFFYLSEVASLNLSREREHILVRHPEPSEPCPSPPEAEPEILLLTLRLNQQLVDGVIMALQIPDGPTLWLPTDRFRDLRVKTPDHDSADPEQREFEEGDFFPITALTGAEWSLDRRRMHLEMTLPLGLLYTTQMSLRQTDRATIALSNPGVFINYDFHTQYQDRSNRNNQQNSGGVVELGVFGQSGLLTQSALYRRSEALEEWVRLETSWRRDNPRRMTTTVLGDGIAQPGTWGRPVRYGGISWGTNFATRPDMVTFPQPTIVGEAATTASVDIYVNNMRRSRTEVPAGPFTLDQVPVLTGAGNIRLVTRDLLGRETVINQPFYGSSELLRPGLYAYNVTLGYLRHGYGRESNRYGEDPFISSTHRYGLTRWLTGEVRAEARETMQTYGLAASLAITPLGALHWASATSRNDQGEPGYLSELRLERLGPNFTFGARARLTDEHFQQLSPNLAAEGETHTYQAFARAHLRRLGSVSISYLDRTSAVTDSRIASLGYNTQIAGVASLAINASRLLDDDRDTLYQLSLTVPLGSRTSAGLSAQGQGDAQQGRVSIQRRPAPRGGFGFRAEQYLGDRRDQTLYTQLRSDLGTYRIDIAKREEEMAYRAGARGSLVFIGGHLFAADWLSGSFAAVSAGGLADLPVYRDNHHVTDTNHNGWALVTGLRPFQTNRIRVDERDLPMDTHLTAASQPQVPGYRRGLVLNFDIVRQQAALITLVDPQGRPMPPGTEITSETTGDTFVVSWEGMAYLTGLAERTHFRVRWHSGQCRFSVDYPDTTEPLPELGEHVCVP